MEWQFTLSNTISGDLTLSDEPIGWAGTVFNFTRDMQWHGIFFEYSLNLQFYGEGFDYIKNIYETQGIDAQVTISIQMKCSDTDSFTSFFEGKLVIPKCAFDCKDDCLVSVPIEQAGCLMKFKNRINQAVDLNANKDFDRNALDAYSYLPTSMHLKPKAIVLRSISGIASASPDIILTQHVGGGLSGSTESMSVTEYLNMPLNMIISPNELSYAVGLPGTWSPTLGTIDNMDTTPFTAHYYWVINATVSIVASTSEHSLICCCGYDSGSSDGTTLGQLQAYLKLSVGGTVHASVLIGSVSGCDGGLGKLVSNTVNITYDGVFPQGEDVKLYVEVYAQGDYHRTLGGYDIDFIFHSNVFADVNVRAVILKSPSTCQVYAINEALSRTAEAVTNDCMRVYSDYFGRTDSKPYSVDSDGCGSLEVLTKGLLIRQFKTNMPVSFQQLFLGLNAIHNIGIGLEPDTKRTGDYDWIRVEPMEYFYDSSIIFIADNVPEIKKTVMPDMYATEFEFGYAKWETENTMGLDEVCTKRFYRSTLSELTKKVTQISSFIASGYSIEVTRNKEFVKDSTTDWRLDNDIFIICVLRDAFGQLQVEQGQDCADMGTITNIIEPTTIYNYRISPVRNFLRWVKGYMGDYFYNVGGVNSKYIFTKGEGNYIEKGKLTTGCILETAEIKESDDINISSFADATKAYPLFKYEHDEFDYPLSVNELAAIRANPRGLVQYRKRDSDSWSYGFISSISYKPNDGKATFILLPKYEKR